MDQKEALDALRIDRDPASEPTYFDVRRRILVGLGIVLVVGLAAASWWIFHPRLVHVQTIVVAGQGGGFPSSLLNASGYVVAQQQATVAAQITGMISAVYVQEGQRVQAGQVLARLDDSAAKAAVALAISQMEADRTLVPQYQAQLIRDRKALVRTVTLSEAGALSQSQLDSAVASVKVDEATLAHARGQVTIDQRNVSVNQTQLSYTVIRAPFDGVVTERYAHPGEMISPDAVGGFTQTGICTLVDMQSLEINVDVNKSYIQRIHLNQSVDAVLDAYPDWHIPGHVVSVVPTANQQKGTVKVRIAFTQLTARILPQMAIQVWFQSDPLKPGEQVSATIYIPQSAVHGDAIHSFAYVVDGGQVKRAMIKTGPTRNGRVSVLSGLNDGDRVVTLADGGLSEGEKVREQ